MSVLEDDLRNSFRSALEDPPPATDDRAGVVIHAARRYRRRRLAGGLCAAVVTIAVLVAGMTAFSPDLAHRPSPAAPASATNGYGIDVRIATDTGVEIWPAGAPRASTRSLPTPLADSATVYRVPDGWIVAHGLDTVALALVTPDGTARTLVSGIDPAFAIAPDGRGLAWRAGGRLNVGRLVGGRLTDRHSTPAPERGSPYLYTGTVVYLGWGSSRERAFHNDVWVPAAGDYRPHWDTNPELVQASDMTPDGRWLIGTVGNPLHPCLARLDPLHGLRTVAKRCLPGRLFAKDGGDLSGVAVSPDGRYVALDVDRRTGSTEAPAVDIYAMATLFTTGTALASRDGGTGVAWAGGDRYLVTDGIAMFGPYVVGRKGAVPVKGRSADADSQPIRRYGR